MTAVTATRFSLAEYHPLGELGFLGHDDRVELIRHKISSRLLKVRFTLLAKIFYVRS
jgi:hypothetical protein